MDISLSEYAKRHDRSPDTLRRMAGKGRFSSARKIGRNWVVDSNEEYPVKKRSVARTIRALSLFSGCGGLDLGLEGDFSVMRGTLDAKALHEWTKIAAADTALPEEEDIWVRLARNRFKLVFANDIRQDAKAVWSAYFGARGADPDIYRMESIVDLVKDHKEGKPVFPQKVDIVTGGFPCQDFSIAGKRKGFQSDKNHMGARLELDAPSAESRGLLYIWMREVIAITQPKVFIAENVKGLVNLADVKAVITEDFRSIGGDGYLVVDARVLRAADYGVPQTRDRVIFIGFKKKALNKAALRELSAMRINPRYDPYPPATHGYTSKGDDLAPPVKLSTVLAGLPEPEFSPDKSHQKYSKAKYMGRHCQGQTEVDLDGTGPTIRSEHHGNIEFRRLSAEHGGRYADELLAGLPERRLSVRECARIQTFPDDYEFIHPARGGFKGVSATDAYKLIGNALPPLLGYHIAKRLEANWDLYFGA